MSRSRTKEAVAEVYNHLRESPLHLCAFLGFEPWKAQRLILEALQRVSNRPEGGRIAVKSGQGAGKTAVAAISAMWLLIRWPGTQIIVTAPTKRQTVDIFLTEFSSLLAKAPKWFRDIFNVQSTQVVVASQREWKLITVTATRTESAQGYHRPYGQAVIYDEATGIPRAIWQAFKGTQTGAFPIQLAISNPTLRDSEFHDCFTKNAASWEQFTINCEDAPAHIVNQENIRLMAEEFGKDSDVYRFRVLGEFPFGDPNCVMSSDELYKAQDRTQRYLAMAQLRKLPQAPLPSPAKQFGIDFARFGSDESVIYARLGDAVVREEIFTKTEPEHVVNRAFQMQHDLGWSDHETFYVADAGGMGQGIMYKFHHANKNILEFHTQSTAVNTKMYENRMTEAWFTFARRLRTRPVFIPKDSNLVQQLSTRKYHTQNPRGRFELESKDKYMHPPGEDPRPSPDRADGLMMAFYDHPQIESQLGGHKAPEITKPPLVRM